MNKSIKSLEQSVRLSILRKSNRISDKWSGWLKVTQIEIRIAVLRPTSPAMHLKDKQRSSSKTSRGQRSGSAWLWQDKTERLKKTRVGKKLKSLPELLPKWEDSKSSHLPCPLERNLEESTYTGTKGCSTSHMVYDGSALWRRWASVCAHERQTDRHCASPRHSWDTEEADFKRGPCKIKSCALCST